MDMQALDIEGFSLAKPALSLTSGSPHRFFNDYIFFTTLLTVFVICSVGESWPEEQPQQDADGTEAIVSQHPLPLLLTEPLALGGNPNHVIKTKLRTSTRGMGM
jgi:hypothetical protein